MQSSDLTEVRRICRVAFGTFLGLPDPEACFGDKEYVFTRWKANPEAALVAEVDGKLAGSNFLTRWGSFGFFGPLTVSPEFWNQRIAQKLLEPTVELFDEWGLRETGLFTFAHSPKHVALYQKFGFWPRFLTALMSKTLIGRGEPWIQYSGLVEEAARARALRACRELTDSIYEGLDVTSEIRAVQDQNLGDTVLLWEGGDSIDGFAVCHCGPNTEAGHDTCYLKFAAARSDKEFARLLEECEAFASAGGLHRLEAGMNLGRSQAYRQMLQQGFRTDMQGVAMHRPDAAGYNRPDVFVIDDWR
jgi:GNAT superfamily N-acetyltransferase